MFVDETTLSECQCNFSVFYSTKMVHLEKMKSKLHHAIGTVDLEDKCLDEYKAELNFLMQEKMAHVEELRLINADINLVK